MRERAMRAAVAAFIWTISDSSIFEQYQSELIST